MVPLVLGNFQIKGEAPRIPTWVVLSSGGVPLSCLAAARYQRFEGGYSEDIRDIRGSYRDYEGESLLETILGQCVSS